MSSLGLRCSSGIWGMRPLRRHSRATNPAQHRCRRHMLDWALRMELQCLWQDNTAADLGRAFEAEEQRLPHGQGIQARLVS